ncbi:MAG: tetratricopeptide repeat protein [Candidatus Hatepunaea meridiana]|nr:tetratricopeptide repeat protein [Candidatus Hatepunaea meridiana]
MKFESQRLDAGSKKLPNFGWVIIGVPVVIILCAMLFESTSFIEDHSSKGAQIEADNYCAWGRAMMKEGLYPDAIAQFNGALSIKPDFVDAVVNLGMAHYLSGENRKALKQLNKALKMNPLKKGVIYNNLGLIFENDGKLDLAIQNYWKAAEFGLGTPKIWRNIGMAEIKRENWVGAIEAYNEVIKKRPTLQNLYLQMLRSELTTRDNEDYFDDIKAHLERGVTEDDLAPYYAPIANYFLRTGSGIADDYINLALTYEKNNQINLSIINLSKAVKIQPDRVSLYNRIGVMYAKQGLIDEAEEVFKACLKVDRDNDGARKGLKELCPRLRQKIINKRGKDDLN